MPQYVFTDTGASIFQGDTPPRLSLVDVFTESSAPLLCSLHRHDDCAALLLVLEGSSVCTIDSERYSLDTGAIACINAGLLHGIAPGNKNKPYKIIGLDIKNLHLKGLLPGQIVADGSCPIIHSPQYTSVITSYASILLELAPLATTTPAPQLVTPLVVSLLALTTKLAAEASSSEQASTATLGQKIKEFIDEHYLENLKLPQIAEALHMNKYYLSHTFKNTTGYSPMQYVTQRRISEAQSLLLSTELTITEIALRCGWNDSNYFQNVFNSIVGMPPGRYRKAWKTTD